VNVSSSDPEPSAAGKGKGKEQKRRRGSGKEPVAAASSTASAEPRELAYDEKDENGISERDREEAHKAADSDEENTKKVLKTAVGSLLAEYIKNNAAAFAGDDDSDDSNDKEYESGDSQEN